MAEPTTHELLLECEWLALLLVTAPRKKSLRPVRDAVQAALAAPAGQEPDRAKLVAAIRAFYELPESRQRLVLNGWSPAPGRPNLEELCGAMRAGDGFYVQRCLVFSAMPAAWAKYGTAVVHAFRPAGVHSAVRVEITEGATRAEVLAGLQKIVGAIVDRWGELVDQKGITGVGESAGAETLQGGETLRILK
jgi:hypothetical protein